MSSANHYVNYFLSHRTVTNDLVQKIEKANYGYQPTETSMTAEKLVTHIYVSLYKFAKSVKAGNMTPFMEQVGENPSSLIELGINLTMQTQDIIASLTEEDLNRQFETAHMFGKDLTGRDMLDMAIDHEIHHKGQLFVYVREMGHTELPLYVNMM